MCLLFQLPASPQVHEKRVAPLDPVQQRAIARAKRPGVAVLAGVGAYPTYSHLSHLDFTGRDVDALRSQLEHQGYLVIALKDGEATKDALLNALRDAAQSLDPESGTMIFFFSGHGFAVGDTTYLATFDVTYETLAQRGLPLPEVEKTLRDAHVSRRVLWVDACRNEPGKSASQREFADFRSSDGTRILYSTGKGGVSYEEDRIGHGIFTYYLLDGLRGAAARDDGIVSFNDIAEYVSANVRDASVRAGRAQTPYQAGESHGDFFIEKLDSQSGLVRENPKDGQRYVRIPAGAFDMGCSPGDNECFPDEKPAHEVRITRPFWMSQTPTTVAAFRRYSRETGKQMPAGRDSFGRPINADDQLPVVSTNHEQAAGFCSWAGMRLPTEAEWEYAARGNTDGAQYDRLDAIAWYGDNSGSARLNTAQLWTTDQANFNRREFENGNGPKPVAQKLPNAWKLYDMLGNVWQWTADWYGETYYGQRERDDPTGPPAGAQRVLRGGSWVNFPALVRVSYRERFAPTATTGNAGFRCAGDIGALR